MGAAFDGSVQLLVDSTLTHLDLLAVRSRVIADPALGSAVASDLAIRYSHAVRTIGMHAFGSVEQRVAFDLLERPSRNQLSTGLLEAEVSQQQIADGIGSARQVVARNLSNLRSHGLVATTPLPGGDCQPEPLDRGKSRHEDRRSRSAADHLRREGQHRALVDRERLVQTANRNQAVTEIVEMPNRGHALVIDNGWREVAETALVFVKRFVG